MNAKEAHALADNIETHRNAEAYQEVIALIDAAARNGEYHVDIKDDLMTTWIQSRLRNDNFQVERITNGWRVIWTQIKDDGEPEKYGKSWIPREWPYIYPRFEYKGDGFGGGPAGPM